MNQITESIFNEVRKTICGKDHIIAQTLTGILAGGHIKHGSGVFLYDGERFYK